MLYARVRSRTLVPAVILCLAAFGRAPAMGENWAERLGYPPGKKVLILHADDIGMSWEANAAAVSYLEEKQIQSGSLMIPCPWAEDFAAWLEQHPEHDVGIHLTLNSEWERYRWGATERFRRVSTLLDRRGFLLPGPQDTFLRSSRRHVRKELRAQVRRAQELGITPTHLDTHIGTVFARPGFLRAYLDVSIEHGIPAMTMGNPEATVECLVREDFPFKDQLIEIVGKLVRKQLQDYPFPRIDVLCSVPKGDSYEEVREAFFDLVRSLDPGITEFFFHPSVDTPAFRKITNSWQQRVWESQLFADPEVLRFFEDEGILFTSWREMTERYEPDSSDVR